MKCKNRPFGHSLWWVLLLAVALLQLLCCPNRLYAAQNTGNFDTDVVGTLAEGEEQTVFVTDIGKSVYYRFETGSTDIFKLQISSNSKSISLILADGTGKVLDIVDTALSYSDGSATGYVITDIRRLKAGEYRIGVASNKVAKVQMSVQKLPTLEENVTQTSDLDARDLVNGYVFTPTESRQYQFLYASDRSYSGSQMCLYSQSGTKIKDAKSSYMRGWGWDGMLFRLSRKLKAGRTYYIVVQGELKSYSAEGAREEITVSRVLQTDGTKLKENVEVRNNIESYYAKDFYTFTPQESGTYFFNAVTETANYPHFSVYNEKEGLVETASLKLYSSDSDGNRQYKKQVTLDLKKNKTYYISLRLTSFQTGSYTFRVKKLQPVKRISIIHKPEMKRFVKGLDSEFDLEGTALTIHYKDGKTSKWYYGSKHFYLNGCLVECSTKKSGTNMAATFQYRGKTVSMQIPIVEVTDFYKDAPQLSLGRTKTRYVHPRNWTFFRMTPEEKGLYRISSDSDLNNNYRVVVYDQNGKMVKSSYSHWATQKVNATTYRYYQKNKASVGLSKGETYYIGVSFVKNNEDGQISVLVKQEIPATPKNLELKKDEYGECRVSFDAVKNADGYQIVYYRVDKAADKKKVFTVYSDKNYIDSLKEGNTYRFKVRAYKLSDGHRYYGAFGEAADIAW